MWVSGCVPVVTALIALHRLFHTPTLIGRYIARYMARPIATLLYVYIYTCSQAPLSPFHVGKVALDDEDSGVCVCGGGGGG